MAGAVDLNNAWFYCYQFSVDFRTTFKDKFASFLPCEPVMQRINGVEYQVGTDCSQRTEELFFSFMFNMIGNSLQLREAFTLMGTSYSDHDTEKYFLNVGNIVRILYDFESYNVVREEWRNEEDAS